MRLGLTCFTALALLLPLPPTHATAPVPVEAFASSARIYAPRLSPDGQHLSVTVDSGEGQYALAVYRTADMQPTSMLKFARYELPVQSTWVSTRRLVIAKGRKFGSLEAPRPSGEIIATDFDGNNRRYIYGPEQAGRNAGLGRGYGQIEAVPRQANGRFFMRAWAYGSQRSMLYDVEADKGNSRLVADIGQERMSFVLDHTGTARYATGTDVEGNEVLYQADARGSWRKLADAEVGGRLYPFFDDDGTLYARLSRDGAPFQLVRWDGKGQGHQVLASDGFASVGDLQWSAPPRRPLAVAAGSGQPQLTYLDGNHPDAATHRMLAANFPGSYLDFVDHSEDGNISLIHVHSDSDPGSWHLFNRAQRRMSKILVASEALDPAQLGRRQAVRFKASDGLELEAILTLPAGVTTARNLPMVLLPHGGPHGMADGWSFDTWPQFLASRGYLVMQVNYRGSAGRGPGFEQAGYLQWGGRIQDDLIDGVRWAIAQGHADPRRICAFGASFGAYSAMMVAARAPGLLRCAAGLAGVYDLKMMYRKGDVQQSEYGLNYLERVIGRDDQALTDNSPVSLANRIQVPVLLVHGQEDTRTPLAQATAMRAALVAAGRPPEYLVVPKEGHGFYRDENNVLLLQRLEQFLARHSSPLPQ
jgi:dipeptidyl aminopeptidase/acylaminoacyl peptidase